MTPGKGPKSFLPCVPSKASAAIQWGLNSISYERLVKALNEANKLVIMADCIQCSLGSSLIIFFFFFFYIGLSLVKNNSLGNFDFDAQITLILCGQIKNDNSV